MNHPVRAFALLLIITLSCAAQGCAAIAVADAAVGTTVAVGKAAVKGTVGAGKLVYKGGKAAVGAVSRVGSGAETEDQSASAPTCLNPDGSYSPVIYGADGNPYCA